MPVTPVYIKGPKCKPEKYRLISLTCICCKVLEHIIASNTMSYLDQNNLLFHNQHGFRSRVNCETQLIQFSQDLYNTLNQGGQTDVIVMDFSKAFDKVDHQRLLLKLHRLGINTTVIAWIKSFLSGRSQSVVLDGEQSGSCPVLSWVPQGSVHARLNQKQHQAVCRRHHRVPYHYKSFRLSSPTIRPYNSRILGE